MSIRTRRYAPVPKRAGKFTEIRVYVPPITIAFRIEGPLPPRNRRVLALAIFRALRLVFRFIEGGRIHHFGEGHLLNLWKDSNREISFAQALEAASAKGRLGFVIRMWRLNAGLTQRALARAAGVGHCHLSQIEHGHCLPKPGTIRKIEAALRPLVP